jgi:hypothetical protein
MEDSLLIFFLHFLLLEEPRLKLKGSNNNKMCPQDSFLVYFFKSFPAGCIYPSWTSQPVEGNKEEVFTHVKNMSPSPFTFP